MKTLFFLFLSLAPFMVTAEETPNETIFSVLQSWYDKGQDVTWNQIKGSYSGRCYLVKNPDNPRPYILTYVDAKNNNGPGFPPQLPQLVQGIRYADSSIPTDAYDNISKKDLKKFQDFMRTQIANSAGFTDTPTVAQKTDMEPNFRPDFLDEYRRYDQYIVNRMTLLISQNLNFGDGNFYAKAGDVIVMCYYFNQVGE